MVSRPPSRRKLDRRVRYPCVEYGKARVRALSRRRPSWTPTDDDLLLTKARRRVRRRFELLRDLPLEIAFAALGAYVLHRPSKGLLLILVLAFPLLLLLRHLIGHGLGRLVGSEEVLIRREFERLKDERPSPPRERSESSSAGHDSRSHSPRY